MCGSRPCSDTPSRTRDGDSRSSWRVAGRPPVANVGVTIVELIESERPRMTGIRVDGDTAVATYSNGDRTPLRKVDGRWLIDSF